MKRNSFILSKETFTDKKTIVAGIQGSGKTVLSQKIINYYKCVVMTLNKDDVEKHFNRKPNCVIIDDNEMIKNFDMWIGKVKKWAVQKKINAVFIDDADVFFKSAMDTQPNMRDIWSNHRHYGLTIILASHRLQDIPARLYGQTENLILFTMESPHTQDLLNKIYPELGDKVKALPYKSYEFIIKKIGQPIRTMKYNIRPPKVRAFKNRKVTKPYQTKKLKQLKGGIEK